MENAIEKLKMLAPKLVEKINVSEKREIYYKYVDEVVEKCEKLIEKEEYVVALNEYKFMVANLVKEFE